MKLTDEVKNKIDSMSYMELLNKWRHAPLGDEIFGGESGEYFHDVMNAKKYVLPHGEHVRISKLIGW